MNPARGQPSPSRNTDPGAFKRPLPIKVSVADDKAVRDLAASWGCHVSHLTRWGIRLLLEAAARGERPDLQRGDGMG